MRKQSRVWTVTLSVRARTIPSSNSPRIETLTMCFQRATLTDAAEELATEAREHGTDVVYYTKLCEELRRCTASEECPRGRTVYYGNRSYAESFTLQAQRDLDPSDGLGWYGLSLECARLNPEVAKAIAKVASCYTPSQAIAALLPVYVEWSQSTHSEPIPAEVPAQFRDIFGLAEVRS